MILIAIVVATLAAGIGSVWLADALLRLGVRSGAEAASSAGPASVGAQHLLSLAAGALLATAFMHLLPEAFESQAAADDLFGVFLIGVVFFFLLDKAELWHHGHEHSHDHDHGHHDHGLVDRHAADLNAKPAAGWSLLTGDSLHCFGDGVLIASAFLADMRLGVVAALSVLAHEVPHHIGDLVVLRRAARRDASSAAAAALLKVSLAGAVTVLGGIAGYFLVGVLQHWLPFFLVVASSSFVYVALADLIPQLQRRLALRDTAVQVAWLLGGIALVTLVSRLAHGAH